MAPLEEGTAAADCLNAGNDFNGSNFPPLADVFEKGIDLKPD
jgi:hypothetical protein